MANRAASDFTTTSTQLYDTTTTIVNISSSPISAMIWFYPTSTGSNKNLFSQAGGTGSNVIFMQMNSVADLRSYIGGTTIGATTLSTNTWYNLAFAFPGGTGTNAVFVNGVSDGTNSVTGSAANGQYILGNNAGGTVGANDPISWSMLFDVQLSASQIAELQYQPFAFAGNLIWMPDLVQDGSYRDLSDDQNGNPTLVGTINGITDGPPVFLLGGQ